MNIFRESLGIEAVQNLLRPGSQVRVASAPTMTCFADREGVGIVESTATLEVIDRNYILVGALLPW